MKNEREKWKPELKPEIKTQVFSTKNYLKVARHENQKSVSKAGNGIGLGGRALVIIFLSFMFTAFIFVSSFSTPVFATSNPGHPASQVDPGTFPIGNYIFQQNLTVSNNVLFVDNSTGRIGIRTTSPGAPLDVRGALDSQLRLARIDFPAQLLDISAGNGRTVFKSTDGLDISYPIWEFVSEKGTTEVVRLYIDATGNVGIGTTAPGAKLHVASGNTTLTGNVGVGVPSSAQLARNALEAFATETDTAGNGAIRITPSDLNIGWDLRLAATSNDFTIDKRIASAWSEVFRIQRSSGNVGIGTTGPGYKLEVNGTFSSGVATFNSGIIGTTAAMTGLVSSISQFGTAITDFQAFKGVNLYDAATAGTATSAYLTLGVQNSVGLSETRIAAVEEAVDAYAALAFYTKAGTGSPTERMRISTSGNVGIGTTSPSTLLHLRAVGNSSVQNLLRLVVSTASIGDGSGISFYENENTEVSRINSVDVGGNQELAFWTRTGSTLAEAVRIKGNGNVGIGTTTPRGKLDIWGQNTANPATPLANAVSQGTIILGDVTGTVGSALGVTLNGASYDTYIQARNLGAASTAYNLLLQPLGGNVGIGTTGPRGVLHVYSVADPASTYLGQLQVGGDNLVTSGTYLSIGTHPTGNYAFLQAASANIGPGSLVLQKEGGNVGIGTTGPLGLLHIHGGDVAVLKTYSGQGNTAGGDAVINAYRLPAGDAYLRMVDIVALGDDTNNRASAIRFLTTNTSGATGERVRIDGTGNVGIGTTLPTSLLHVKHPSGNLTTRFEGLTNAYTSKLYISSTSSGDGGIYYDASQNLMNIFSYGDLRFNVGTGNIAGAIANERMIIQQGGNVGIGVTVPELKLDVNGSAQIRGYVELSESDGTRNGVITTYKAITGSGTDRSLVIFTEGDSNGDDLHFMTGGSATSKMIILSGGNVGIGTTSPNSKLHVVGEVNITGVSGDGSGKVVCIKADGNLGTCSSVVSSGGTCTCG